MKKSILSLAMGAIVALTSCSQSDEMPGQPQEGEQLATFTIETPAMTRAAVDGLSRYIVEAYEGATATGTSATRVESSTSTLTLTLKKDTQYTFLFWADKGTAKTGSDGTSSGYWDTNDLKAVTVTNGKTNEKGEVAYCLTKTFNSANFETNKAVELKNATAQVNFVEKAGLPTNDNTLTVKYSAGTKLNVGTGKVEEVTGKITHTFTAIAQAASDATIATDYILAPKDEQKVLDLTIQLNDEPEKPVTNVPFEQSYKTNIKGEYSSIGSFTFTITADDAWETPDKDVDIVIPAAVGDYYYMDGTWSADDKATDLNPIMGVVYKLNDDGKSGKVVLLAEGNGKWSTVEETTEANSTSDGKANTEKILTDKSASLANYPIFEVCKDLRTMDGNAQWYIPVAGEYQTLLSTITTINPKIKAQNGTEIVAPIENTINTFYWQSCEASSSGATNGAMAVTSMTGSSEKVKTAAYKVRYILDF